MTPKKKSGKKAKKSAKKSPKKSLKVLRKRTVARKKSSTSQKAKRIARKPARAGLSQAAPLGRGTILPQDLPSPDDDGLSRTASADSESVDELLDEGNAFEAGIVSGVEQADNSDGKEVRTREVLEDDVPSEYLDNDS